MKLQEFKNEKVKFIETIEVKSGVLCDVYEFIGNTNKDLAIIKVQKGYSTPLQKIIKGDNTIEGFISGNAVFQLNDISYEFPNNDGTIEVNVNIGDTMQWIAKDDLVFYEICYPPYEDGRYKNL
ncbi:hypothetical protein MK079_02470 [Candidatus Gracilibacteria bacterium]|nr:hypothetical protein [Candidatus Gracilibacteria bacterium]